MCHYTLTILDINCSSCHSVKGSPLPYHRHNPPGHARPDDLEAGLPQQRLILSLSPLHAHDEDHDSKVKHGVGRGTLLFRYDEFVQKKLGVSGLQGLELCKDNQTLVVGPLVHKLCPCAWNKNQEI